MGNFSSQQPSTSSVAQSTSQGESSMPSSNSSDSDNSEEFEVEAVLGRRIKNGGLEYQLKWKGYNERSWQPVADCDSCKQMIAEFDKAHPSPSKSRPVGRSESQSSNGRTPRSSQKSQSKKSTRDSSDSDSLPDTRRGNPSSTSTPSNGRNTRNQSTGQKKSRAARDSTVSSEESLTLAKLKQKKPATSGKRDTRKTVSSSSESEKGEEEEEEVDEGPSTSRMAGKAPTRPSSARKSAEGKPPKRKRVSSSQSTKDSESESGSQSSEEFQGAGKRSKRELRRSPNKRKSINLSMDEGTPRRGNRSTRNSPRKNYDLGESTDEEKEKEEATSSNRSARKGQVARRVPIEKSDSEEEKEEEEEEETDGDKLVAVLTKAISVAPVVVPVRFSPAKQTISKGTLKSSETMIPVQIFKPEDLPGLEVWSAEAYSEKYSMNSDFKQKVEKFCDREVERIVGYCLHAVYPFVLVQLAQKKNEKTFNVKDVVQGVHSALAARLFPKAFADYTNRMARQSQMRNMDVAGPSGSTPASNGRGKKGKGG